MWGSGTVLAQWYLPSSRWPVTFQNTQYKISVKKATHCGTIILSLRKIKKISIYVIVILFNISLLNKGIKIVKWANSTVSKIGKFMQNLPTSRWCNTGGVIKADKMCISKFIWHYVRYHLPTQTLILDFKLE